MNNPPRPLSAALAIALLALASGAPCGAGVHVLDFDTSPPAGRLSANDIPDRTERFVIDETGSLPPELRLKTESTLAGNTSTPTYLLIKKGSLPISADLFGNELLRRWIVRSRHLSALVMTVTDPLPETHVVLAGRKLGATDIRQLRTLGEAVLALSAKHSSQAEGAAAVTLALVPALATFATAYDGAPPTLATELPTRSATGSSGESPDPQALTAPTPAAKYAPTTSSHWDEVSSKLDWPLIRAVAVIVGCVIFLIIGAIFLPRAIRTSRYYFPEVEPRTRFSAPFAGGSNAQIKFRP